MQYMYMNDAYDNLMDYIENDILLLIERIMNGMINLCILCTMNTDNKESHVAIVLNASSKFQHGSNMKRVSN